MKLRDIKISARVYASMGFVLAVILLISGMTFLQVEDVFENTQGMYEHLT